MFSTSLDSPRPNERGEFRVADGISSTVFRAILVGLWGELRGNLGGLGNLGSALVDFLKPHLPTQQKFVKHPKYVYQKPLTYRQ